MIAASLSQRTATPPARSPRLAGRASIRRRCLVADARHLLSPDTRWVTGEDIAVTGGYGSEASSLNVYAATHRGLTAALLAAPDGFEPERVCCTAMVREALDGRVARTAAAGALNAGASTGDLPLLANAIGIATEADPATAVRLLRLAMTGMR